jgi:hypothetical protein
MKTFALALGMLLFSACSRTPAAEYDAAASAAFYAAWRKGASGDDAGKVAALEEIARRYPDSRAGMRAKELLHPQAATETSLGGLGAIMISLLAGAGYFARGKGAPPLGSPVTK